MKFHKIEIIFEKNLKDAVMNHYPEWVDVFEKHGLFGDPYLNHLDWFGENLRDMQVEPTQDMIEKYKEIVSWRQSYGRRHMPVKLEGKNWEIVAKAARMIEI